MKSRQTIAITTIMIIFSILALPALATNDIAVNKSGNSTAYTTSATWAELENVSISTGTGNTTLTASYTVTTNYSGAIAYGGFYKDGVQLYVFNMSTITYPISGAYTITFAETVGTHYYALKVYSTAGRKSTIYNRNLTATYLNDVSILTNDTAQITRPQVTGQEGVDTAQNTSTLALETNTSELQGKIDSVNTSVSALQVNDTTHDALFDYVNTTYLLNATYNGDFPNATVAGNLANWNSTFNGTYDGFLVMINALQVNDTYFNGSVFPLSANFRNDTISAIQGVDVAQNATIADIQGVDITQNMSMSALQGVNTAQNTSVSDLQGVNTAQNASITNINATVNGTNRVQGKIAFSINSSTRVNNSNITILPAPYNGEVAGLNITVVEGAGTANVSLFISNTYAGNVNLSSGSYASTMGLALAFTESDILRWKLDTASTNLRFTVSTVTRRS